MFYNKDFNGTKQTYSGEQWRQPNENTVLPRSIAKILVGPDFPH